MAELGVANKLILAFVTLLVGVILIGSIASEGLDKTTFASALDESHILSPTIITGRNNTDINETITYTLTYAPSGWKAGGECPITSFVITNSSGFELTETTDYVVDLDAGTWVFVNSAGLNDTIDVATNQTLVDYNYCADDYLNLGWGRTVVNMVAGFFAIALLLTSVGLFYSVAKDTGMI
jgi:hypothetical protein